MMAEYNAYRRQRAERLPPPAKKAPPKAGKYDRHRRFGLSGPCRARRNRRKNWPRKARAPRAELSPLEIKIEAAYVLLVETALAHVQALQEAAAHSG